ncbi:D-glycerate dehydrogenase [Litorivicinus sp.]|nr:D-glycerate dehydrogenase [Litorivicinus sp.]MDC1240683.1 D-glycerate dehydrogenase [Litorivicinus sp.]
MVDLSITRLLINPVLDRARKDYNVWINSDDHIMTSEELIERSFESDALLICHSELMSSKVVAQLSDRVKIIANYSVGVDHCDLEALKNRGIVVTNTPDVLSDATAEIAILLLLASSRRAFEGDQMLRKGTWEQWAPIKMNGIQVTGKKLGIVGMGRVGQVVAKRARGFDMEIHYSNRSRLPKELERGAVYHDSLESLFSEVDMLSLNCPATPESKDMINRESIQWMRPGMVLVNTARGSLVDEDALIDALQSEWVAAAGLDVFKTEPGGNSKFADLPNVFMLPHLGSSTRETRKAMGDRALENLDAFFAGEAPKDRLV